MRRLVVILVLVSTFVFGTTAVSAQGTSLKDLVELFISLGIIVPEKAVQARQAVSTMGSGSTTEPAKFCYNFGRDLTVDSQGVAVAALSNALSREGLFTSTTNIFDEDMAAAVVKFQAKYGIRQTGYVGPVTRAKLNSIYGCGMSQLVTTVVQIPTPMPPQQSLSITSQMDFVNVEGSRFTFTISDGGNSASYFLSLSCPSGVMAYVKETSVCGGIKLWQGLQKFSIDYFYKSASPIAGGVKLIAYDSNGNSIGGDGDGFFLPANLNQDQPSVTLLTPNGGESITKGQTYRITWNSTGVSQVYIKLRKGTDTYYGTEGAVSPTVANTGYYNWTVPTTLPDGSDYGIRVIDSSLGTHDDSNASFTINSNIGLPPPNTSTVSASIVSASEDKAGTQYVFGPGGGAIWDFPYGNDWKWNVALNLPTPKTIQSIELYSGGNSWSTSNSYSYPVVVYKDGSQLNTAYGQTLGTYSGSSLLTLYTQIARSTFSGGTLTVKFTDGTFASVPVGASAITADTLLDGLNFWLYEVNEDKAGTNGVFGPGAGVVNLNPSDWKWKTMLSLGSPKSIRSVVMVHGAYGEAWSTSADTSLLNKQLYPLVISYKGKGEEYGSNEYSAGSQLASAYDVPLGSYAKGSHLFAMYGQRETTPFKGSKLIVTFTDESKVETSMPARNWPTPMAVILPPPTVTLSANPISVVSGGSSTLTWSSTNATSCTANGEKIYTTGSLSTGALYGAFIFTVNCVGAGGTNSASVTVNVAVPLLPPPPAATSSTSTLSYDGSNSNTASLIQAFIQLLQSLQ